MNENHVGANDAVYSNTLDASNTDDGPLTDGSIESAHAGVFAPNGEIENDGGTMDDLEIPSAQTSILDDTPGWRAVSIIVPRDGSQRCIQTTSFISPIFEAVNLR